jgi:hypothetical protein
VLKCVLSLHICITREDKAPVVIVKTNDKRPSCVISYNNYYDNISKVGAPFWNVNIILISP